MKQTKKQRLLLIISEIELGTNPAKIAKKHNIKKQTVQNYLRELQKLGIIEKVGYGVWVMNKAKKESINLTSRQSSKSTNTSKKEIRGHAFIWKIEFVDPINWAQIIKNYKKKTLTFQVMNHNKVIRTIFQNRKIWLGLKGMTIYEPIDFLGRSSFEVKGRAVFEMDLLVKGLLRHLGVKFRAYRFTTSREHYGIIKNELARQYNNNKEKMLIRSEDGSIWMWIDDSKGLGELENDEPSVNRQVQNFWNSHKAQKFKVDADFTLDAINKLTSAQVETNRQLLKYEEQNREHLKVIQMYQQESKLRQEESEFNKKVMMKILEKLG